MSRFLLIQEQRHRERQPFTDPGYYKRWHLYKYVWLGLNTVDMDISFESAKEGMQWICENYPTAWCRIEGVI